MDDKEGQFVERQKDPDGASPFCISDLQPFNIVTT